MAYTTLDNVCLIVVRQLSLIPTRLKHVLVNSTCPQLSISSAKLTLHLQMAEGRVHSIQQFLQQGTAADEWNDLYKYLLAFIDIISAVNVLDWSRDSESVYLTTAAIARL